MFVGLSLSTLALLGIMLGLLVVAYIGLHRLQLPFTPPWLVLYSSVLVFLLDRIHHHLEIHLEALLPAFVFGCLLHHIHPAQDSDPASHEQVAWQWIDPCIKGSFMLLVGCALPALELGTMTWQRAVLHVIALTLFV